MTLPLWPRATTSAVCFQDGWEDDSVELEAFIADSFDTDLTSSTETFYKLSVTSADDMVIILTAYNEALDDYLPVAQASVPSGGGVLRITASVPRDTLHRFELTGSESDVDYENSFLTITRSKT